MKVRFRKVNKYGAKPTRIDGIHFASQKEAKVYLGLKERLNRKEIWFFLMQVPFRLPGGYKHLVDFMIVDTEGNAEFLEVKGRDLSVGKLKREQVEDLYGVKINVV